MPETLTARQALVNLAKRWEGRAEWLRKPPTTDSERVAAGCFAVCAQEVKAVLDIVSGE